MAFWGAPLPNAGHARSAVRVSLDMIDALARFNAEGAARGEPPIAIGIGLNTGSVVIGNMGSRERFDYTIMGDADNLGSRVEGKTKTYQVPLLVTEATARALGAEVCREHDILMREVDRVTVKGKSEPVALFEVVPRRRREAVRAILNDFNTLRERYYEGAWSAAREAARRVLAHSPEDGPTRLLLERVDGFLKEPPQAWRGVYAFTSK